MYLKEKQLALQILTACTLNCNLCADYSPLYAQRHAHKTISEPELKYELKQSFSIYDYIEDFTLTGGEPLLHRDFAKILEDTMQYREQFSMCRIFTNGTIVPNEETVRVMKKYPQKVQFVVDDYGPEYSVHAADIRRQAEKKGLLCRVNVYHGDQQHCGGWVDYGLLSEYHNDSEAEATRKIRHCHNANWKNLLVFDGKLYVCTQSAFGSDLGFFKPNPDDFIDLHDAAMTLEQKKEIASRLGSKPTAACQYCNGFDVENSPRFPAGRQLPRGVARADELEK